MFTILNLNCRHMISFILFINHLKYHYDSDVLSCLLQGESAIACERIFRLT